MYCIERYLGVFDRARRIDGRDNIGTEHGRDWFYEHREGDSRHGNRKIRSDSAKFRILFSRLHD